MEKTNSLPHKPVISVCTLGCKVNRYDTDAMLAVLENRGFTVLEGYEFADVYIINTCAVTAEAERKSRQTVGKVLAINPEAEIYVCGCASQNNFSQFAKDGVNYISGTDGKLKLAEKIAESYADNDATGDFEKIVAPDFDLSDKFEDNDGVINTRTRHFIKVQDGCNNFCSYCIVPYLRGRSRSRSLSSIIKELDGVEGKAKEVVITGINLSAYGNDINISIAGLLTALQKYGMRFRLGSLEVGVITDDFLRAAKELKAFCPHFHLSLQSGDDAVLKDMNRRYDTKAYAAAVAKIREYFPDAAITTDIIVGFPTESEQSFENTLNFAREIGFSDIHVFSYSSRKGTAAGRLKPLPADVLLKRQKIMTALKRELSEKFMLSQLGKEQEVVFETKEDGMWCGHSRNYVKVYSLYGARNALETVIPTVLYNDGVRV